VSVCGSKTENEVTIKRNLGLCGFLLGEGTCKQAAPKTLMHCISSGTDQHPS